MMWYYVEAKVLKRRSARMAAKAEKPQGKLVAVELAGETSALRPVFSNYVLLTMIEGEPEDNVTLTFIHVFPLPGSPGSDVAMRGEPVARVQLPHAVAIRVRNLFVSQLGLTHQELDAIIPSQQRKKRVGRRKSN